MAAAVQGARHGGFVDVDLRVKTDPCQFDYIQHDAFPRLSLEGEGVDFKCWADPPLDRAAVD